VGRVLTSIHSYWEDRVMKTTLAVLTVCALAAAPAAAQSAKSAVQVNHAAIVNADCGTGWSNIANVTIHTSSQKDLVMGASLETILMTDTWSKARAAPPTPRRPKRS